MAITKQDPGYITIEHSEPLVAGRLVTVRFIFEVGTDGMAEGGRLRVALPNPGWGEPLAPQHYFWDCYQKGKDRRYTDYDRVNTTVVVSSSSRAAVPFLQKWPGFREPFGHTKRWLKNYDRWWIEVTLEDDGLDQGDKIIITYGDTDRKPFTARVQGFPDRKLCFLAFVDAEGKNAFREAEGSPWMISVESGPASRVDVWAPSVVRPGEVPGALVAYTDAVKVKPHSPPSVDELVVISPAGDNRTLRPGKISCSIRIDVPELSKSNSDSRSRRISIRDPERAFSATSNPTIMREAGPKLFWGDLHVQSQYHDWSEEDQIGISCGTPEELYDFAHNTAGLDFCANTDTYSICNKIWPVVRAAALKHHRDGEFVIFQGTEIGDNINGHRNTIFATDTPEPAIDFDSVADKDGFFSALSAQDLFHGRDDVLMIYHHTKIWNNWSRWDPTVESVLEIYSAWGSGECAGTDMWRVLAEMSGGAQQAWAKGYRLGVVAGSDTHVGTPGRNMPNCERDEMLVYPNGITGVWASELTRQSIFGAIKKRHCYGTSGVRIILEFFLEEHPMGSEVLWPDSKKPRQFRINVYGTDEIKSIEIVRNNVDVQSFSPRNDCAQIAWSDTNEAGDGDYYYVRVTQRDGHRAWSSPVWINCVPEE